LSIEFYPKIETQENGSCGKGSKEILALNAFFDTKWRELIQCI